MPVRIFECQAGPRVQGRFAVSILEQGIGSMIQKPPQSLGLQVLGGKVQGRPTLLAWQHIIVPFAYCNAVELHSTEVRVRSSVRCDGRTERHGRK